MITATSNVNRSSAFSSLAAPGHVGRQEGHEPEHGTQQEPSPPLDASVQVSDLHPGEMSPQPALQGERRVPALLEWEALRVRRPLAQALHNALVKPVRIETMVTHAQRILVDNDRAAARLDDPSHLGDGAVDIGHVLDRLNADETIAGGVEK